MDAAIARALGRVTVLCSLVSVLALPACGQRAQHSKPATQAASAAGRAQGAFWKDAPEKVNVSAKYLFYLHGMIVIKR